MNFRHHRPEEPQLIDLAPVIDMVFTLLIFFAVSTSFSRAGAEIQINLPQTSTEQSEEQPKPLELSIDADGRYYLNSKALADNEFATLLRALSQQAKDTNAPILLIRADGKASHQSVITAMDAARQAGLIRISFATEKKTSSPDEP